MGPLVGTLPRWLAAVVASVTGPSAEPETRRAIAVEAVPIKPGGDKYSNGRARPPAPAP
jgi:hypothetical protein